MSQCIPHVVPVICRFILLNPFENFSILVTCTSPAPGGLCPSVFTLISKWATECFRINSDILAVCQLIDGPECASGQAWVRLLSPYQCFPQYVKIIFDSDKLFRLDTILNMTQNVISDNYCFFCFATCMAGDTGPPSAGSSPPAGARCRGAPPCPRSSRTRWWSPGWSSRWPWPGPRPVWRTGEY